MKIHPFILEPIDVYGTYYVKVSLGDCEIGYYHAATGYSEDAIKYTENVLAYKLRNLLELEAELPY